jgi:hypothetical protein
MMSEIILIFILTCIALSSYLPGILLLTVALFVSARMGIYQEVLYGRYGKHPRESLFYTVCVDRCLNIYIMQIKCLRKCRVVVSLHSLLRLLLQCFHGRVKNSMYLNSYKATPYFYGFSCLSMHSYVGKAEIYFSVCTQDHHKCLVLQLCSSKCD